MIRQRLIGAGLGLLFLFFFAFTVYFASDGDVWRALCNVLALGLVIFMFVEVGPP